METGKNLSAGGEGATLEVLEVLELIEIADHASSGKEKPKARHYAFLVGKARFVVDHAIVTGAEILELAGKRPPEAFVLRQVFHDGALKVVEPGDKVDLRAPGVERFRAMPRTAQDGC